MHFTKDSIITFKTLKENPNKMPWSYFRFQQYSAEVISDFTDYAEQWKCSIYAARVCTGWIVQSPLKSDCWLCLSDVNFNPLLNLFGQTGGLFYHLITTRHSHPTSGTDSSLCPCCLMSNSSYLVVVCARMGSYSASYLNPQSFESNLPNWDEQQHQPDSELPRVLECIMHVFVCVPLQAKVSQMPQDLGKTASLRQY